MSYRTLLSGEKIKHRFGAYRKPTEETIPKFKVIQEKCYELADLIDQECPESQEKATALTLLVQVKMLSNAAVALYHNPDEVPASFQKQ